MIDPEISALAARLCEIYDIREKDGPPWFSPAEIIAEDIEEYLNDSGLKIIKVYAGPPKENDE
jgi:hypothetical protein